jgi:hypothetical protein
MKNKAIIILIVLVVLLGAALAIALTQYGEMQGKKEAEKQAIMKELEDQKDINANLVRAASEQVKESDIRKIVTEEMGDIEDDLKGLNAKVNSISRATGRLERSVSKPTASDSTVSVDGMPEVSKDIKWENGAQELPVAWARVKTAGTSETGLQRRLRDACGHSEASSATKVVLNYLADPDTAVWETGTYPIDFEMTAATAEIEGGIETQYVQLWAKSPDSDERIPLTVMKADFLYTDPEAPEFRLWTPHLDGGLSGGYVGTDGFVGGGSLGISIMSYGVTPDDNIWRFVRVAGGTDGDRAWLEIDPAGYNVGQQLPLIDDMWIWAGGAIAPSGYGGMISITSTF